MVQNKIKASIITVGDEILIGQITDTNSVFLAEQLTNIGIDVHEMKTVGDSEKQITDALDCSLNRHNIIVMTGGLGPTDDDITKYVLAKYFNTTLVQNDEVLADIEEFVVARGFTVNERNRKQALVPKLCTVIRNTNGTAPGMWFEKNGTVLISVPAVPFEMKEMFTEKILAKLLKHFTLPTIVQRTVLTHGIPESHLAEQLQNWEQQLDKQIKLAYLPSPERLRLRLSIQCTDKEKAQAKLEAEIKKLHKIIGRAIYGEGDYFLEHEVFNLLKKKGKTVVTAESCTGGSVAAKITSIAGSSQIFLGSVVAYSNDVKINKLDVPKKEITKHGAVSKEVVENMAVGALNNFKSDYSIAVSGIAGPDGGTIEKPVGTVWIAVADRQKVFSKKFNFGKRRNINIRRAGSKSLDMLRKFILDYY